MDVGSNKIKSWMVREPKNKTHCPKLPQTGQIVVRSGISIKAHIDVYSIYYKDHGLAKEC